MGEDVSSDDDDDDGEVKKKRKSGKVKLEKKSKHKKSKKSSNEEKSSKNDLSLKIRETLSGLAKPAVKPEVADDSSEGDVSSEESDDSNDDDDVDENDLVSMLYNISPLLLSLADEASVYTGKLLQTSLIVAD